MKQEGQSEEEKTISYKQKWQQANLNAASRKLIEEDSRYFMHQSMSTPVFNVLQACEGVYIEDLQARRYIDFHGNNVHQVGFANPEVIDAIKNQLDELSFCPRRYTKRTADELANKLTEISPADINNVLLCPSGTISVGMALKL